jgi:hypothetical protein
LGGILYLLQWFVEKDNIVLTKRYKNQVLRFASTMEKYSPKYTLKAFAVNPKQSWISRYRDTSCVAEQELEVNHFFDAQGNLHQDNLRKVVEKLIQQVNRKTK